MSSRHCVPTGQRVFALYIISGLFGAILEAGSGPWGHLRPPARLKAVLVPIGISHVRLPRSGANCQSHYPCFPHFPLRLTSTLQPVIMVNHFYAPSFAFL